MVDFTGTIAQLNPGAFWAHPDSLGLSEADRQYVEAPPDETPQLIRERIDRRLYAAMEELREADCGMPFGKPS